MFEKITPESAGISTRSIIDFIKKLEKRGASMHGILFMKGDKIFTEAYWKPFNKDFCHRMYSQTKSFVGIAIGLLQDEGKLSINDKIIDYFPEKVDGEVLHYHKELTIKDMLTMSTAGDSSPYWFFIEDKDRTHAYFNGNRPLHPSGTIWEYDSTGSQVLCSLVEKLAGKSLLAYMKEKIFDKMGVFGNATVLKTRNEDSWGDSAMICTLRDIAAFGRLLMNNGVWNGESLISEQYVKEATSKIANNAYAPHYSAYHQGYGYQIWRVSGNGFAFNGMGDQLTICYPDKDLLFSCIADNQGTGIIREMIFQTLEDEFINKIKAEPIRENKTAQRELDKLISSLKLFHVTGEEDSPIREEISGKEYVCNENKMGITKFSFVFNDAKSGEFRYTNAQGDKVIPFGVNYNVFGKFPQFGYSNEHGGTPTTDGSTYDDAVSLAWLKDNEILIYVQIIDRYFGNMNARFAFKGDEVYANFTKRAEDFLKEYEGSLVGRVNI